MVKSKRPQKRVLNRNVTELKSEARRNLQKAKRNFKTAEKKIKNYIKTNPVKATLIAGGIGAALGRFLKKK